jgi:hypothetical protein
VFTGLLLSGLHKPSQYDREDEKIMKIKFRDVYEILQNNRKAVSDMGLDVTNVLEGEGKCLISDELDALKESYADLYNSDIKLNENVDGIRAKADACLKCLDLI